MERENFMFIFARLALAILFVSTLTSCLAAQPSSQERALQATISALQTQVARQQGVASPAVTPASQQSQPVVTPSPTHTPQPVSTPSPKFCEDQPNTSDLKILPRPEGTCITYQRIEITGVDIDYKYNSNHWNPEQLVEYFQQVLGQSDFVLTQKRWSDNNTVLNIYFKTDRPAGESEIDDIEINIREQSIDVYFYSSKGVISPRDFVNNIFQNPALEPDQPNSSDLRILPRPEKSYIYKWDFAANEDGGSIDYYYDRVYWSEERLKEYLDRILAQSGFVLVNFVKNKEDILYGSPQRPWRLKFKTNQPVGASGIREVEITLWPGESPPGISPILGPVWGRMLVTVYTENPIQASDFERPVVLFER
jgi:hypothetical protein